MEYPLALIVLLTWLTIGHLSLLVVDPDVLLREDRFLPYMRVWLKYWVCIFPVAIRSIIQVVPEWFKEDVLPQLTHRSVKLLTGVSDALEKR